MSWLHIEFICLSRCVFHFFGLLLLLQRRRQTTCQTSSSPHQCICLQAFQSIWKLNWNRVGFRPWPPWAASRLTDSNNWEVWLDGTLGQAAAFQLLCRMSHRPDYLTTGRKPRWKVLESDNKEEEKGTVRAESEATQRISLLESIRMERLSLSGLLHCHSCQFSIV